MSGYHLPMPAWLEELTLSVHEAADHKYVQKLIDAGIVAEVTSDNNQSRPVRIRQNDQHGATATSRSPSSEFGVTAGMSTGVPSSLIATITKQADVVGRDVFSRGSWLSTFTLTFRLVVPASYTYADSSATWPTGIGFLKSTLPMLAVTHVSFATVIAEMAASSSISFTTSPPWAFS